MEKLEEMGIVKIAKNPTYGAPAFVVPKKGPKKWRMIIDLRALNEWAVKTSLQMPILEAQIGRVGNAKHFASFDILSGFDYLPVHEDSQKYFTLVTQEGSYTMIGSPMGFCNTPQVFQARILEEVLKPTKLYSKEHTGIIQWVDDSLLYADTFDQFLDALDKYLKAIINKRVRLNVRKCDFYAKTIEWCGRKITHNHWGYLDKYFTKILDMQKPFYAH